MNILMMDMPPENMTASIENDLRKEAKKLAINLERAFNELIEGALRDLLKNAIISRNKSPDKGIMSQPVRPHFSE
jgi:hypothetical protein